MKNNIKIMCTVTLNINEAEVRELNPSLTDMASINRWAQRVIDDFIASRRRSKEQLKPYTMEELNARIDKAERDSAEGRYRDFDEAMDEIEAELAREKKLKPYTMEELHAMIAESERQIAAGQYQDFDEAMDEIEAELAREEELEMAEAV